MEHFVKECRFTKSSFLELGVEEEERWRNLWSDKLGECKGKVLIKFWKQKAKLKKGLKEKYKGFRTE